MVMCCIVKEPLFTFKKYFVNILGENRFHVAWPELFKLKLVQVTSVFSDFIWAALKTVYPSGEKRSKFSFSSWTKTGVSFTVQRQKLNLNWIEHYTALQKIYFNWSYYFSQFIRKNLILKHIAQTPPPFFLIMKRHSINDITYPSVGLSQVIFHQLALNNTQILNDSTKSNSHRRQQAAEQYFSLMQIIIYSNYKWLGKLVSATFRCSYATNLQG